MQIACVMYAIPKLGTYGPSLVSVCTVCCESITSSTFLGDRLESKCSKPSLLLLARLDDLPDYAQP